MTPETKTCVGCGVQFTRHPDASEYAARKRRYCTSFCNMLQVQARAGSRFWSLVDKSLGENACWPWTGGKHSELGYGNFRFRGRPTKTHRVAWILHTGQDPGEMWVLHKCDNPPCCNPSHLFLGTVADNNRDKMEKGRHVALALEDHHMAKLTEEAVLSARQDLAARIERGDNVWKSKVDIVTGLVQRFGVSRTAAKNALRGVTWKCRLEPV